MCGREKIERVRCVSERVFYYCFMNDVYIYSLVLCRLFLSLLFVCEKERIEAACVCVCVLLFE